VAQQKNL